MCRIGFAWIGCLESGGFCTGGKGPPGRFEMNPTGCAEGIRIFSEVLHDQIQNPLAAAAKLSSLGSRSLGLCFVPSDGGRVN